MIWYLVLFLFGFLCGVLASLIVFLHDYGKVLTDQRMESEKVISELHEEEEQPLTPEAYKVWKVIMRVRMSIETP